MSQARRNLRLAGVVAAFMMAAGSSVIIPAAAQAAPLVEAPAIAATSAIPLAVTVNNPGTRISIEGSSVSLQMTATGGTAPYTWSATGLPLGLSINATSGLISGTLTRYGNYSVVVTATATVGGSGSTRFLWGVKHDACQHCSSGE